MSVCGGVLPVTQGAHTVLESIIFMFTYYTPPTPLCLPYLLVSHMECVCTRQAQGCSKPWTLITPSWSALNPDPTLLVCP